MSSDPYLRHRAFRIIYDGVPRVLNTPVHVKFPTSDKETFLQYEAVWDTGATNTVITPKVAQDLKLAPIDVAETYVVNSTAPQRVDVYLIDIGLPNKVMIRNVKVTCSPIMGCDVLIGMDMIQRGDFNISKSFDGKKVKTMFSFCIPSHTAPIDLLDKSEAVNQRNQSKRITQHPFWPARQQPSQQV